MATLADTVKNSGLVKQGSGLASTSSEELSSLSQATGRAANPISPLGAKLLGSNPDQVKMAGADANKQASLNASVTGNLSLRDTVRQGQASGQMTEEEKKKEEQKKQLSGLQGSLDNRVQLLAEQKLGGQADFKVAPKVDATKVASLFPGIADSGAMANNITKLFSNPTDLTAVTAVAKQLGFDTQNLSADELISKVNQTLDSQKDQLSGLAAGVENSVKMSDIFNSPEAIEALGDPAELAEALGVSAEDFQNLDIPALQKKMEEMGIKSFNEVSELQRRAADPYTTGPERAALNKELQRLGASGVRGNEQDYQRLQEEVNSANQVEIGGRSYTTEELLSDANVSAMVADYLTDPAAKEALAGTPLATFIEKNRAVLTEASNSLSGAAKALVTQNQKQRDLAKTASGTPMPDNVMKALFPSWGTLGAEMSPDTNKAFTAFKALPSSTQDAIVQNLQGVTDPSIITSVMSADSDAIQALAATPGALGNWISFRKSYQDAANLAPDAAIQTMLGRNPADFAEDLKEYYNAKRMGLVSSDFKIPLADVLDANHDGVLDDPTTLKAALLQHFQDAASKPGTAPTPAADLSKFKEIANAGNPAYQLMRSYVKQDGYLDRVDAEKMLKDPSMNESALQSILDNTGESVTGQARSAITKELTNRASTYIADTYPELPKQLKNIQNVAAINRSPARDQNEAVSRMNGMVDVIRGPLASLRAELKSSSPFTKAAAAKQVTAMVNSIPLPNVRGLDPKLVLNDVLNGMDWDMAVEKNSKYYKNGRNA